MTRFFDFVHAGHVPCLYCKGRVGDDSSGMRSHVLLETIMTVRRSGEEVCVDMAAEA